VLKALPTTRRCRSLNVAPPGPGPVIYWMSRDQRAAANWALLHARARAAERGVPFAVVFCLTEGFPGATRRAYDFMLGGLEALEARFAALKIPFFLLRGDPPVTLAAFVAKHRIGAVVTDFDPLRVKRQWKSRLAETLPVAFTEVDAHNVVPAWVASPKREYGAYTLRPKIHKLLDEFLTDFPPLEPSTVPWTTSTPGIDWRRVRTSLKVDERVGPLSSWTPGEAAGAKKMGRFLTQGLSTYADHRNDPTRAGQSDLSPYLHFGQVSAQKLAWEVRRRALDTPSGDAFLEELIVRRELSDNYCLYNDRYDAFDGFPDWARKTLDNHRRDKRAHLYTRAQFESAATHDALWNAAQREMVLKGKTHGYLRMYWAKKILEWSESPEEALATAIDLNDRYELDGRDPNGYAGVAWSIGGVHDRPWFDRPVYGQIRYMSEGGCRSKFDVDRYIASVEG
jgi:deoxyribodipyrimidine photo-lyase